ncbi:retron system putative HNH endonuclease [Thalassospira sp.]|uniref:retron system putative HNH endonuclease n=1 Tax=Thalassospira sp. TaxID=1912094 RepID=UPI000C4AFA58|nr:retron system putative HNH endonuclease [Thalassospira sp.]MBC07647.1 TIGR02646 family protein [Thalassospira sp.]|tara:strand:- start:327 stop:959 length:633 start_codon:yes stop_codon:yes gene_type:complete
MKYIEKKKEPECFSNWKSMANDDWTPTYKTLSGKPKRSVQDALLEEQGSICCYCERRLTLQDSHIEHFNPQSNEEVDPLDFSNMLFSCQNILTKSEPKHCGNLKGDWFDPDNLVSPFVPECEDRFSYMVDGRITPKNSGDEAARQTIERLGLDIPKIRDMRKRVIEVFIDEKITQKEIKKFVQSYLEKDTDKNFNDFHTTIRILSEKNII